MVAAVEIVMVILAVSVVVVAIEVVLKTITTSKTTHLCVSSFSASSYYFSNLRAFLVGSDLVKSIQFKSDSIQYITI